MLGEYPYREPVVNELVLGNHVFIRIKSKNASMIQISDNPWTVALQVRNRDFASVNDAPHPWPSL
jgi:hypothetical protein